jgi:hypothetical protein
MTPTAQAGFFIAAGTVVSESGAPLPSAFVYGISGSSQTQGVHTNAQGAYRLELRHGTWELAANRAGYTQLVYPTASASTQTTVPVTIQVSTASSAAAGTLRDGDGATVANALLSVSMKSGSGASMTAGQATTDAAGAYSIPLAPGTYTGGTSIYQSSTAPYEGRWDYRINVPFTVPGNPAPVPNVLAALAVNGGPCTSAVTVGQGTPVPTPAPCSMTVSGSGYEPSVMVFINVQAAGGQTTATSNVTTDSSGRFVHTFTIDKPAAGTYKVYATGSTSSDTAQVSDTALTQPVYVVQ